MKVRMNQLERNLLYLSGYVSAINGNAEDLTQEADWLRGHACGRGRMAQIKQEALQALSSKALAAAKDIVKSYRQLNEYCYFDSDISQDIADRIWNHLTT